MKILKNTFSPTSGASTGPGGGEPKLYEREFPPKEKVQREIQGFIDRGGKAFYIYSGGMSGYYNYEKQFFHMHKSISFQGRVSHRYFKNADHTFTDGALRLELRDAIKQWIKGNFSQ